MKPLSELTLLDRFLFACAMENQEILQSVLQIILGQEIELRDAGETEKELRTAPWLRSIRLDVFTLDKENSVYNAEVQKKNVGNLVKRSRFYQSLIDSSLLPPGEIDFNRMPQACLITIMPFDLFGYKKYRYTFRMKCEETDDLWMGDGAIRIFLNTHGKNDGEVSPELVELLHYFETTSDEAASGCESERIKEIHKRICRMKASEEIGVKYMQEWEEKIYELREAKEEGLAEGLATGRTEGLRLFIEGFLEEGFSAERIVEKLVSKYQLSNESAWELYRSVAEKKD